LHVDAWQCINHLLPHLPLSLLAQGKSSGNPNCLCNLLPAPGGFRRAGLWAKEGDVVGTLGPDPGVRARKVGQGARACVVDGWWLQAFVHGCACAYVPMCLNACVPADVCQAKEGAALLCCALFT